jgi:uncharacterized protein (TIGR03118 family)
MGRSSFAVSACLGLVLAFGSQAAHAQYTLTNLNSNQVRAAKHIDPLLVNGWGLVFGPGSPWWISDAGSGWSTLYNGVGKQVEGLKVVIPTAGGNGPGSPTGIVFNGSTDFQVNGSPAVFIFDTLDGTISGWAPSVNFNQAIVAVNNNKAGAVYTGLAVTNRTSGNLLYAADVANNKVDVYDGTFALVNSFTDTALPAGFTPFGIQDIGGMVYVAFASATGGTGGFIDVFQEDGTFVKTLIQGVPLSQPWGITIAPKNFGKFSNMVLISNETPRGTINAFDPATGKFMGSLRDKTGKIIEIDLLWGIAFGGGSPNNGRTDQLFFTAGPAGYQAGTFGVIGQ